VLRSGAEVLSARASTHFTRFDGNLAGLVVPSPANGVTSATRLEGWASCPFGYLLQNVLGVEQVDNPEEELSITALTRGSLVHDVLERFMLEALDRRPGERIRPEQPWPAADRARMVAVAEQLFAEYEGRGLTGRPIFWRRDRERILADLLWFLDLDDVNRRLHRLEPLAAELAFGFGSGVEAVPIELPDGRAVRFRGMADRVDVAGDGTLHVVDYKTGSSDSFKGLGEDDPDLGGRKLQLPVYGVAARLHRAEPDAPVLAQYWFVSTKGKFGRIGYRLTPELLEHVGRTLGMVVAGIEAGVFPAFPATPNPRYVACDPCDPDGLGVSELFRAWARKRSDPALAIFANLVDPI
jgi:hypothetical protein